MKTIHIGLATAVVAALLCGCRMCQSPFDYCTPMTRPDGCPCFCDFSARMNSMFSPPAGAPPPRLGPTEATRSDASPGDLPQRTAPRQAASARARPQGFVEAPPDGSSDDADDLEAEGDVPFTAARLHLPEAVDSDETATR